MKLAAVLLALFAVIAAVLAQTGRTCRTELYEHCGRVRHDARECVECGGPSERAQANALANLPSVMIVVPLP